MYNDFTKNKMLTRDTIENLYKQIKVLPDEDKCVVIVDIAKDLIKRGGEQNWIVAEELLLKCIQSYFNVDNSNYKASIYLVLGQLYELKADYVKSFTYYEKYALNNTVNEGSHALLLRALLLRDNFTYSDALERELIRSYYEYDLGLRNDRIYEGIAEYLVLLNEHKTEKAEEKKTALKALVKYGEFPILDIFIRKDTHLNALNVPQKVTDFIKNL